MTGVYKIEKDVSFKGIYSSNRKCFNTRGLNNFFCYSIQLIKL